MLSLRALSPSAEGFDDSQVIEGEMRSDAEKTAALESEVSCVLGGRSGWEFLSRSLF